MAKIQADPAQPKTLKQCLCGATFFQGPFPRGEIVNDVFEKREELYQCVNCNKVQSIAQMIDRTITPVVI
jgi:hypothetical protein